MKLHIIYTKDKMILSKINYSSWREIQDEYEDYKTSLGPWDEGEVIDYLTDEYPNLEPEAKTQIAGFVDGPNKTVVLRFND